MTLIRLASRSLFWLIGLAPIAPFLFVAPASAQEYSLAQIKEGTHIHGLATNPVDPESLYLATHHGLFLLAKDGKATLVSPVQDFMGFSPHPSQSSVLYASGHPAEGGNLGFIMSVDGGRTWRQIAPGIHGPVDFHQMSVSPADPNVIYGAYGSIQVSRDGGKTWAIAGPAPDSLIQLAASRHAPDRVFAATKSGLMVSEDAGATWAAAGLEDKIVSLLAHDADGGLIAFALGEGLMRSPDEDLARWEALSNSFGESIPLHLAADPSDANHLYLATNDNRLLVSQDGGRSWRDFGTR